jgi:enamine deaminase RidA (YjgF/YER057c/UK114 family)
MLDGRLLVQRRRERVIRAACVVAGAAALVSCATAPPADRPSQQRIVLMSESENSRRSQEELGYPDAVISGNMVYLSGIVVELQDGETDMAAAYDRVYRRIAVILARAGSSWTDVVDMTSYHTDVIRQINVMSSVHKRYATNGFPAWTAIDVDRLIPAEGIAEIKIVARRSAEAGSRD